MGGAVCWSRVQGSEVVDAEAAAEVDVGDGMSVGAEVLDEGGDAVEGFGEGVDFLDLGADVNADAGREKGRERGGVAVEVAGERDVDAELVLAEAGGDVGVGFGEDVGVDAEGEARLFAKGGGASGEEVELLRGFDVEEEDVGLEGGVDLPGLLADTGEDDAG